MSSGPSGDVAVGPLVVSDLDDVTTVHIAAFPKSALTRLGRGAVRGYYEWQLTGPHDATSLGARSGGDLVGFCIGGTFDRALFGFLRRDRALLVKSVLLRPWLLAARDLRSPLLHGLRSLRQRQAAPVAGLPAPAPERSFGILAIAVAPHAQGEGVAAALMDEAGSVALRDGYDRMHLTVAPGNARAIRFYEKRGWVRVPEPDGGWAGAMEYPLQVE